MHLETVVFAVTSAGCPYVLGRCWSVVERLARLSGLFYQCLKSIHSEFGSPRVQGKMSLSEPCTVNECQ
jgi:hypothetical protein